MLKVKQVYEVAREHKIPIMGQGGICNAEDAIEFMIAGATTVGIGTALFYDPLVCRKINENIVDYLKRHRIETLIELIGSLDVETQKEPVWN